MVRRCWKASPPSLNLPNETNLLLDIQGNSSPAVGDSPNDSVWQHYQHYAAIAHWYEAVRALPLRQFRAANQIAVAILRHRLSSVAMVFHMAIAGELDQSGLLSKRSRVNRRYIGSTEFNQFDFGFFISTV